MKQPKSSNKNKRGPSSRRPPRDHQPPYEPYLPEPYQPEPFQPHLYPSPYKASRYPDVVSHPPGKFDDSSDEIIVSPAMRYAIPPQKTPTRRFIQFDLCLYYNLRFGSPSRNLPSAVSASNYREPRNFEGGRQQAALPPGTRGQVPGKSHESVQHPYSSSNRNRMSDRRPSPPRQRHQSRYPDDYQSNISYEGPPANYFDNSDRKMAYVGAPQSHEGLQILFPIFIPIFFILLFPFKRSETPANVEQPATSRHSERCGIGSKRSICFAHTT